MRNKFFWISSILIVFFVDSSWADPMLNSVHIASTTPSVTETIPPEDLLDMQISVDFVVVTDASVNLEAVLSDSSGQIGTSGVTHVPQGSGNKNLQVSALMPSSGVVTLSANLLIGASSLLAQDSRNFTVGNPPEPPSFELELLNHGVVVKPGEQPKFRIAILPVGNLNSPVWFSLPSSSTLHRFEPNGVQPPALVNLLLEPVPENVQSGTKTLKVQALSNTVPPVSRTLDIQYWVVKPDPLERPSSLFLEASRTSLNLGDAAQLTGSLSPVVASASVYFDIQLLGEPTSWIGETQTDTSGRFTYLFSPESAGAYNITARWDGNGSYDASQSNPVTIQALPRTGRISLRLDKGPYLSSGESVGFSGNASFFNPLREATAEVSITYLSESRTESLDVPITQAGYHGSLTMNGTGLARLTTRWWGYPPDMVGSVSAPVLIYVGDSSSASGIQETIPSLDPGVSVIIAGGSSDNLSGTARDYITNNSYTVLRHRRFNDARLLYANDNPDQDLDGDGNPDAVVDYAESSSQVVEQALVAAAGYIGPASPVTVFVVAERGDGQDLLMGDATTLGAADFDRMLGEQLGDTRDIRVLIEASSSGSFCDAIRKANRTVISSSYNQGERASYVAGGLLSFGALYWSRVQEGWGVTDSFDYATDYLNACFGYYGSQTPRIYTTTAYNPQYLYYGLSTDATDMLAPDMEGVFEPIVLDGTNQTDIYAWATDDVAIASVQAVIMKPDGTTVSVSLDKESPTSRKYKARLTTIDGKPVLDQLGVYDVAILAQDTSQNVGKPLNSKIAAVSSFDLTGDGKVDGKDLLILLEEIGKPEGSIFDLNGDGRLDYKDLFVFCQEWQN